MVLCCYKECGSVDKSTVGSKGNNYRKRYPTAQITNAAYKRLLARVDRQVIKLEGLQARMEDLEERFEQLTLSKKNGSLKPT